MSYHFFPISIFFQNLSVVIIWMMICPFQPCFPTRWWTMFHLLTCSTSEEQNADKARQSDRKGKKKKKKKRRKENTLLYNCWKKLVKNPAFSLPIIFPGSSVRFFSLTPSLSSRLPLHLSAHILHSLLLPLFFFLSLARSPGTRFEFFNTLCLRTVYIRCTRVAKASGGVRLSAWFMSTSSRVWARQLRLTGPLH